MYQSFHHLQFFLDFFFFTNIRYLVFHIFFERVRQILYEYARMFRNFSSDVGKFFVESLRYFGIFFPKYIIVACFIVFQYSSEYIFWDIFPRNILNIFRLFAYIRYLYRASLYSSFLASLEYFQILEYVARIYLFFANRKNLDIFKSPRGYHEIFNTLS